MTINDLSRLMIEIAVYSLALWLGLYLLARDWSKLRLRLAGLGLLSYALILASSALAAYAPSPELALLLRRLHWPLLFLPALFWFGVVIELLPEELPFSGFLSRLGRSGLWPLATLFYLLSAATPLVFDFSSTPPSLGPAYPLFAGLVLLPLGAALVLCGYLFQISQTKRPLGLLLAATLFFSLAAALLVLPLGWLSRSWLLLMISLDLELLGLAVAWLDALDEGELLLPDFLRSLTAALLAALLFAGPVGLTMLLATGLTWPMLALLLATIATAIASQTLAEPLQAGLDYLAFRAWPGLRQARAELRQAAEALPRANEALDPATVDDAEFIRLTRRALSQMGNLPRLAASPLIRLPLIEARLKQRQARDDTLERAAELKRLLAESICQLKPRDKGDFGTSEEWRYYNALYFPYVVGLKPYSRRADYDGLDPAAQAALDWFRTYVPERTLYNWQNAAAELVAGDLRERQREMGK